MSLLVHTDFAAELAVIVPELAGKIFPIFIGANAELPAISYTFRDGDREVFYRNSFGLETYNVSLDIYGNSYMANQGYYDAIVTAFNGQSVLMNNSTLVQRGSISSTLNSVDPDDNLVYRTLVELQLVI